MVECKAGGGPVAVRPDNGHDFTKDWAGLQ